MERRNRKKKILEVNQARRGIAESSICNQLCPILHAHTSLTQQYRRKIMKTPQSYTVYFSRVMYIKDSGKLVFRLFCGAGASQIVQYSNLEFQYFHQLRKSEPNVESFVFLENVYCKLTFFFPFIHGPGKRSNES